MTNSPPVIRVMLVDDEEDFRIPTASFLRKRGMNVHGVGSVEELLAAQPEFGADIVVLDVNLPGQSGLDAVETIRRDFNVRIVMATACRGVDDRVRGLSLGADSYLEKPIDMRELEAVIRSLWSRIAPTGDTAAKDKWMFDAAAWTLAAPDGISVRLSAAEYNVVSLLARDPGTPVSRDTMFLALGKIACGPEDRSLDVLLSRLRRKFTASNHDFPLKSVRSVGYVMPEIQMSGELKEIPGQNSI
ncbi:MAG: response regulator transcription factor [Rhodospirillales bacterium]|nr:MAG: response regulator transcription factor [Rhodospirillales bacterium]